MKFVEDGERDYLASAVIDATGTWSQPNPLGASGLPAQGEHALRDRITYGMPDVLGAERQRYAGRRVLVAGAGHSAAGSLLALYCAKSLKPRRSRNQSLMVANCVVADCCCA